MQRLIAYVYACLLRNVKRAVKHDITKSPSISIMALPKLDRNTWHLC